MRYSPLKDTFRCITHPFATRRQAEAPAAVRLACVKHAASVQSEPGSNSSVLSLSHLAFILLKIIMQTFKLFRSTLIEPCTFYCQVPTLIGYLFLKIFALTCVIAVEMRIIKIKPIESSGFIDVFLN